MRPGGTTDQPTNGTPSADGADQPSAASARPMRPSMKTRRVRRALLAVLSLSVGAQILGFGVFYLQYGRPYVSTDNAQVDGDKVDINAPAAGYLIDWRARQGVSLEAGEVVGRIRVDSGFVAPQRSIRAPSNATVAVDNGVPGAYVTAGTNLATAYDLSQVYITARVDETDVDSVQAGEKVDFSVDAFPGVKFTGVVREIQSGAAGQFSLFPQSNTTGNFQKVTQVVPVRISVDDLQGLALVPGMNVVVNIHKNA